MRKLIYILLICLSSCYSEKKAEKDVFKAYVEHPKMVADKTRKWFPCANQTIYRDTGFYRIDDSLSLQIIRLVDTMKYVVKDSIAIDKRLLIRQLQNANDVINILKKQVETRRMVETIFVKDSAEVFALNSQIAQLQNEKEIYMKKNESKLMWILYLLIFLCISISIYTLRNELFK